MTKAEIKKLDDILRKRAKGEQAWCRLCGKTPHPKGLHPHHIVGRTNRLLRWTMCNIIVVCFGCHRRLHDNPMWAVDELSQRFGYEHLDALAQLSRLTGVKRDYETVLEQMDWDIERYVEEYL